MEKDKLIIMLKAVADPNRLRIIELLREGSLCACELLEHFNFTQPTLSHHMKILAKAGLVVVEKKGQWHHYELKNEEVTAFLIQMNQLFQPLNDRES